MDYEHGEPGSVLTLDANGELDPPADLDKAAGKVLAEAYPKMVECLASAMRRGLSGSESFAFHLQNGKPCRLQSTSTHATQID